MNKKKQSIYIYIWERKDTRWLETDFYWKSISIIIWMKTLELEFLKYELCWRNSALHFDVFVQSISWIFPKDIWPVDWFTAGASRKLFASQTPPPGRNNGQLVSSDANYEQRWLSINHFFKLKWCGIFFSFFLKKELCWRNPQLHFPPRPNALKPFPTANSTVINYERLRVAQLTSRAIR